jgi:hypothetical protein
MEDAIDTVNKIHCEIIAPHDGSNAVASFQNSFGIELARPNTEYSVIVATGNPIITIPNITMIFPIVLLPPFFKEIFCC